MSLRVLGVLLLGLLPARIAFAQANCQLREAEGGQQAGGIDPKLADVKALLSAPPFSHYPSYRLTATHPLALAKGVPASGVLENHHGFVVTFLERLAEREGRARLRLRFEIRNPNGKPEVNAIIVVDENGPPFPRVEQQGDRLQLQLIDCKPR
jgi:hypothetical protein